MTTPLFMLRTAQLGVSIGDMDLLTIGLIMDMYTESTNDNAKYPDMATQNDFDKF
ncbi:phage-like protein [[Clostridium] saccharolyticum WM1]|uniref:Phage-like protein n=1 Tax=Lacrimispora saccharolytica (strain ATCC 35040 / DSM 2544 / NRCC 2533 / WM1) TaxID=610130 RepID=D9R5H0_LACSW|nr:phage-like protein [[Clostridium] saccharolyticum WM1]